MLLRRRAAAPPPPALKVIVDATADLSEADLARSGVWQLASVVRVGGQSYSSTELSPERLLALIEAQGAAPVIEPPSVAAYEQVFRQALAQSDEVLSLHLSSRLSVSFACGQEAARAFGSRVRVLDSPAGSYALGLQALRAARLAAGGHNAAAIVSALRAVQARQLMHFTVSDVRFMHLSGRITPVTAALERSHDVQPIFRYHHGLVELTARAPGYEAAMRQLARSVTKFVAETLPQGARVAFLHSPGGEEGAERLRTLLSASGLTYEDAGTRSIGNHLLAVTGPRATGVVAEPL